MRGLLWWKTIRPSQAEMACHHAERKKISLYSLTVTATCEIALSSLLSQQLVLVTVWWLYAWVAVMKNDPSQPSRDGLPSCWTEENQFVFSDCDCHLWDCVQFLALSATSNSLASVCMGCCDEKRSVPAKQRWLAIMLNGRKSVCILWLWLPLVRLRSVPCFMNNWWHSGDCMLLWGKLIHPCQADMVCHSLNR